MKRIALLLLAGSLIAFGSCTKTGPQGPQGPAGPAGVDGNANVYGSDPFTPSGWAYESADNWYRVSFTDNDITPDVVDHGVVQIFKKYGTNTWSPLPDINGNTSTVFDFYDNGFTLYAQSSSSAMPNNPTGTTYRVVVIYPSNRKAHPNTDWRNYAEATAALEADRKANLKTK